MTRSLPVWLLASALTAFVGCGGGAATDSGTVASNANEAASASGGTTMPTESTGMGAAGDGMMASGGGMMGPGGGMMGPPDGGAAMSDPSAGMMTPGYAPGGESTGADAAEMAAAYGAGAYPGGGGDPANDPAMAAAYGAGSYPGGNSSVRPAGSDPAAEMAAAYAAGGYTGGNSSVRPDGSDPAAMAAAYGAGQGGTYPGGQNLSGPGGTGAYPGGGYPGGPGGGMVEEKVPEGFDGKAQLAFRRGKEKDAIQYLYAYALTTDAGAKSLLPTMRWVGILRQPKLAVRWGAGFVVTAPRNFKGDPKPVGSQQNIPTRGGSRSEGAGGSEGFAGGEMAADYGTDGGGGSSSNSLLSKGAGELGDKLVAAYTERVKQGDFGDVLKQAMENSSASQGNGVGDGASGYGGAGYPGTGYTGPGGAGPGYGMGGPESGGPGGGAAASTTKVTQIMPGLSMLGIGTQKELIDRARADDIDAVVIIDVKLRVNTMTGLVTNDSTLYLLDANMPQKKLHTTRTLNNINIQKARADGKEDGIEKEFEGLFEAIDANFKMTDLPAGLTAQAAANRVAGLAEKSHDNPLPVLVEAKMYEEKGLLEEAALFAAYEKILGVDFGRLLATGAEEDKKKALNRWLPES